MTTIVTPRALVLLRRFNSFRRLAERNRTPIRRRSDGFEEIKTFRREEQAGPGPDRPRGRSGDRGRAGGVQRADDGALRQVACSEAQRISYVARLSRIENRAPSSGPADDDACPAYRRKAPD